MSIDRKKLGKTLKHTDSEEREREMCPVPLETRIEKACEQKAQETPEELNQKWSL